MGTSIVAEAVNMNSLFFFVLLASVLNAAAVGAGAHDAGGLSHDHYDKTCPKVEEIIRDVASRKVLEVPNTPAGALRIFFHDCFVEGCDASILIASTDNNTAERDVAINLSLSGDGYDVFFRAKRAVELQCPGVVSCADVMAITTRDLVNLAGGPMWEVLKGRKDGLTSKASRVGGNLPLVEQTLPEIISLFHSKGLSTLDMVALSGGHTIGVSHCEEFMSRIYNTNGTSFTDPTMDPSFAQKLRADCPQQHLDPDKFTFNDVTSPFQFDNAYYRNLGKRLGLLSTDQVLTSDAETRAYVNLMASDEKGFFGFFVDAMMKMSNIGVKTGSDGEIRRECGSFNG
ncbi:peroxidase 63-like [Rhodamnia argentea]|uniref:Peroxidase n=1 Tax=Rhodamnia argentea TaxID=178133 RepID=A0A8B8NJ31_9MYRT|nr:peroxidase 63-like [Rhodamnia argentea]